MHSAPRLLGICPFVLLLAGCDGGGTADTQRASALSGRLAVLEDRVAATEQRTATIEQLRNDSASLDRRLSSLETTVRELAARPAIQTTPAPTPPAPVAPDAEATTGAPAAVPQPPLDRIKRRAQLDALSDEFRRRLAELRSDPGASPEGTAEILDWYREQRRAIRRGEGRAEP